MPRKTLDDRVKGKVMHGQNPGRGTVLTDDEEKALCSYLLYTAERSFPLTQSMVMAFAWAVVIRSVKGRLFNSDTGPGDR